MDNLARKYDPDPVIQDVGTVTSGEGPTFSVRTALGILAAERAVSCLVEPRRGDRVLYGGSRREGFYILAILTRADGAAVALSAEGDLQIHLSNGRFVVAAQKGVELISPMDVSAVAGTVHVNAGEGKVSVESLSFFGSLFRAEIESIKLLAERVDSTVDRVTQRLKRSFRAIEESDQVRAAHIDYEAKNTMSLHAANAIVSAESLVKVDGEQIHVG